MLLDFIFFLSMIRVVVGRFLLEIWVRVFEGLFFVLLLSEFEKRFLLLLLCDIFFIEVCESFNFKIKRKILMNWFNNEC